MSIPISIGSGVASVAAEVIGGLQYQQIKVIDGTASSTNKWVVNSDGSAQVSVVGTINTTLSGAGSVVAVLQSSSIIAVVTGSVVAIPTNNQSVSGTVGASVIGWVPVQTSNTSVISYIQNSVATVIIGGSVAATFTPPANQSVSGTVGASVIGWVPIQPSNTSTIGIFQNSSILAVPVGSIVAVFQSSSILAVPVGSVITVWKDSSVLSVPVGSTIAVLQSPSIVGTYAEDSGHTSGDKGLFVLQVRNDTMSSITSTDADYSPQAVGPVGEVITANAPITKWISGTTSTVSGSAAVASVALIPAQGASIFTYLTSAQIYNSGATSALITFTTGGSILGYGQAPTGGGANIMIPNGLKSRPNFTIDVSASAASSVISIAGQGFISKT